MNENDIAGLALLFFLAFFSLFFGLWDAQANSTRKIIVIKQVLKELVGGIALVLFYVFKGYVLVRVLAFSLMGIYFAYLAIQLWRKTTAKNRLFWMEFLPYLSLAVGYLVVLLELITHNGVFFIVSAVLIISALLLRFIGFITGKLIENRRPTNL